MVGKDGIVVQVGEHGGDEKLRKVKSLSFVEVPEGIIEGSEQRSVGRRLGEG